VLAEAGAWPSAPRVMMQGYVLDAATRAALEARLREACPEALGALAGALRCYAETSPLAGFLFGGRAKRPGLHRR
jgi:hypothetical protein